MEGGFGEGRGVEEVGWWGVRGWEVGGLAACKGRRFEAVLHESMCIMTFTYAYTYALTDIYIYMYTNMYIYIHICM